MVFLHCNISQIFYQSSEHFLFIHNVSILLNCTNSHVNSLGSSCRYKRFFPAMAVLVGPVQNIFFFIVNFFNSFVPIAQEAGQAVVQGLLSLSVCLWVQSAANLKFPEN
jgi:hypothetical protein